MLFNTDVLALLLFTGLIFHHESFIEKLLEMIVYRLLSEMSSTEARSKPEVHSEIADLRQSQQLTIK